MLITAGTNILEGRGVDPPGGQPHLPVNRRRAQTQVAAERCCTGEFVWKNNNRCRQQENEAGRVQNRQVTSLSGACTEHSAVVPNSAPCDGARLAGLSSLYSVYTWSRFTENIIHEEEDTLTKPYRMDVLGSGVAALQLAQWADRHTA